MFSQASVYPQGEGSTPSPVTGSVQSPVTGPVWGGGRGAGVPLVMSLISEHF